MNLVNYHQTGISEAFRAVQREAEKFTVPIAGTEIVGLIPEDALDRTAEYFTLLENFHEGLILETRLLDC
jgi:glutamate formiminotransferase